jgi:hypothetical protein
MFLTAREGTSEVVAPMMLPLCCEFLRHGILDNMLIWGAYGTAWYNLAMSPLVLLFWLPHFVGLFALHHAREPDPLPPEGRRYVPKRHCRNTSEWFWQNVPAAWGTFARSPQARPAVTRLSTRGRYTHHSSFYDRYSPKGERRTGRAKNRHLAPSLRLITVTCMVGLSVSYTTPFDSDLKQVAIDSCSSRCLTNSKKDFVPGTVRKCNVSVIGVGGTERCALKGTVRWTVADDLGRSHDLLMPDTPLCSNLPTRLFSPQHWCQAIESAQRLPIMGTDRPTCVTDSTLATLRWGRGKFTKTIPLDTHRNVAVMSTLPGHRKFSAFATTIESLEPDVCCFVATGTPQLESHTVTDDEATIPDAVSLDDASTVSADTLSVADTAADAPDDHEPAELVDFGTAGPDGEQEVSVELDEPLANDSDEFYRLHVRAGHLSFAKLRALAQRGDIPKRLKHCAIPVCAACQYGKATRRPCRTKKPNRKIKPATRPGECVSVDQMESRAVGFIAQMKGSLTHGRYPVATIFVDHHSRLGYVHLQKDASSKETLKAKHAFETYAKDRGVRIQHYHADNGRFVDNAWVDSLDEEGQGITYCGVNAHWQNGIAERRIWDLKDQARTMLLHAQHNWPEANSTNLWPYALRTAGDIFNDAPTLNGAHKDSTPHEVFTGTRSPVEVRHHHTFGCPVYVTATPLQQGKSLPWWMARARACA